MTRLRKILLGAIAAVVALGGVHLWLNQGGLPGLGRGGGRDARQDQLRVGFLPVT